MVNYINTTVTCITFYFYIMAGDTLQTNLNLSHNVYNLKSVIFFILSILYNIIVLL